ncbi:MAG: tRNA glutamyl-Q(34) synthetase GluQRS [Dongiaceae bacterium]
MIVTRFAPSPTGRLHRGHALSALTGWQAARAAKGRFLLRIEDIDLGRCRPAFEAGIYEDLAWLGLDWETPVRRQSEHFAEYGAALARLEGEGLVYPCFCTRAEIETEIAAAGGAPQGPDGPRYPGTCRALSPAERTARQSAGIPFARRLDAAAAAARVGALRWEEADRGEVAVDPLLHGDVVLARKDIPASYHLAVVLDDALQDVSLVTRGEDLFAATHLHRVLQALLCLPAPRYRHHRLVADAGGRRLAKRDAAATLASLRQSGADPRQLRTALGFPD